MSDSQPLVGFAVTICGIPDLPKFADVGVSHVLSLIDSDHPVPDALSTYGDVDHELLRFDDVVAEYPGFSACTLRDMERVLSFGERIRRAGDKATHVLVHCHAGISRSTASAAVLMAQHNPGRETEAFLRILDMRPHAWPNTRIVEFADRLLDRRGALLEGLLAYRRELIARKPNLRQIVTNIGRGHELP